MRIIEEEQLDFDDVLIQPKRSDINSRKDVSIYRTFEWVDVYGNKHELNCIPVMISNMGTVGTPNMAKIAALNGYMCALEKHTSLKDICDLFDELECLAEKEQHNKTYYTQRVCPSIGIKESTDDLKELSERHHISVVCIDVPNGYIPNLIKRIKEIRDIFPTSFIIAGNVVTPDICQDIIIAGANIVKCGIGNGSACLSRVKAAIGRPQLSTIVECADACHQVGGFCMSDGGLKNSGDICKAFGAGADFVMSGSLFAGCEEADGETVIINNKPHKQYYGMSSHYAQEKHFGGIRNYSASEGRTKLVPITGKLEDVFTDISGGIKSCMTYIGAHKLKNIPKQTTFYRVRRQINNLFENCKDF